MVREFSAGGVVLRKLRGQWFVAVIQPHMDRPKKPIPPSKGGKKKRSDLLLALPKGAIDTGEKAPQAALREVREETGVEAELITKLTDVKYFYVRTWGDHARVFKIVSFFLLLYRSGRMGHIAPEMRIEVQHAFWLPLSDAPAKLTYPGEREVAERAVRYLKEHPVLEGYAANPAH